MTLIQKLDRTLSELNITFYPGYYQGNGEDYGIYALLKVLKCRPTMKLRSLYANATFICL